MSANPTAPAGKKYQPRKPALSPSRANDYLQCPLLFRLRTVDKLPEPPSLAATRGTLVHSVLERLYDHPAGQRTPQLAQSLLPTEWQELQNTRPEVSTMFTSSQEAQDWLAAASSLVDTYFTVEDPNRLEPAEREVFVETQLPNGPLLRGVVDRVDIAPDGAMRLVDYKTGKAPRPQYSASAAFQMRFYGLVMWRTRETLPKMLQLVYLGDGQVLRNEPQPGDLAVTEEKIRSIWDDIKRSAEREEWRPKKSRLCDWCNFQPICPAFDGQPPALAPGAAQKAWNLDLV